MAPCPACGAAPTPGDRYCADCGAPLRSTPSPSPGAPLPPGAPAEFRPSVAVPRDAEPHEGELLASQPPAPLRAERKQVTVLFCDLAGSTSLAERLDPEDFRDLLDRYLEIAIRAVHRFDGMVNQLAGDGLMALFGAPLAHENNAQRAVLAALTIQEELRSLNQELGEPRGLRLQVRIGIHSGPAVVGSVGNELKADYSAIGDTTNLAARLESLAKPGTILVSRAVYRAVQGNFACRLAGTFQVKGKSEPVEGYEVLGPLPGTKAADLGWTEPAENRLTPFVGREAHLEQLLACVRAVQRGVPQLVVVSGAPGSGKSRLLYELRQHLAGEDLAWFETRGSAWTQLLPYVPWANLLRRYVGGEPTSEPTVLRTLLRQRIEALDPGLRDALPWLELVMGLPPSLDSPPTEERRKRGTFHAMERLVRAEMRRHPVVLVIEDLHRLDPPSLEMVHAALHGAEGPFLVLVSHRPDVAIQWNTPAVQTHLRLGPLPSRAIEAIVAHLAGEPFSPELVAQIVAKSEGNPFLAEELTRSVAEHRSGSAAPLDAALALPSTVHEVIAARIDRLPPSAKRTLQVASVLGRQFSRAMLSDLLEREGIDVGAELTELERRGVLHRRFSFSTDEYRFGESLTQEVAYSSLLLKERRALHEQSCVRLERSPDLDRSALALLLHHAMQSENPLRAVPALLRAAQAAEAEPSYQAAAELYRKAWQIGSQNLALGGELPALCLRAVRGLARMHIIYGVPDPGDHHSILAQAEAIAENLGDQGARLALAAYDGIRLVQCGAEQFAAGRERVEQAFAAAQEHRTDLDPLIACDLARAAAYVRQRDAQFERAVEVLDQAIRTLEQHGHAEPATDLYCGARWMRAQVLTLSERYPLAWRECDATRSLAAHVRNRTVHSFVLGLQAAMAWEEGKPAEAWELCCQSLDVARPLGANAIVLRTAAYAVLAAKHLGKPLPLDTLKAQAAVMDSSTSDFSVQSYVVVAALLHAGERALADRMLSLAKAQRGGRLCTLHERVARTVHRALTGRLEAEDTGSDLVREARELGLHHLAAWAADPRSRCAW